MFHFPSSLLCFLPTPSVAEPHEFSQPRFPSGAIAPHSLPKEDFPMDSILYLGLGTGRDPKGCAVSTLDPTTKEQPQSCYMLYFFSSIGPLQFFLLQNHRVCVYSSATTAGDGVYFMPRRHVPCELASLCLHPIARGTGVGAGTAAPSLCPSGSPPDSCLTDPACTDCMWEVLVTELTWVGRSALEVILKSNRSRTAKWKGDKMRALTETHRTSSPLL